MVDKLRKIDLDSELVEAVPEAVVEPAVEVKKRKVMMPRWLGGVLVVVLALISVLIIGGIFVYGAVSKVVAKAREVQVPAQAMASAIKGQDLEKTKVYLGETTQKLTELTKEYEKLLLWRAVPFLGVYVEDGNHVLKAGSAGLAVANKAIEALEPNADLLGLKGKSTFVSGTADDRIQTAVKTMSALTPKITEMGKSIETLRNELKEIDPARYPEHLAGKAVRSELVKAKELIENAANLFVNAQPLLVNLPKMLGEPGERRYLVLFQNDKELRPTGGFITAYAQFRIVKGKMILEKADDVYALDNAKRKKFPAPREITTFHKGVYELNIRDSNLSPDFKESMQKFEEMYETTAGKEKIDGIWAVDTHVLVEALKILGPMNVFGREFSAETDKRCDCPKAVYELEDYSTRPVGYVREARKDVIGVLLQGLLQKALGVSPSQYWGALFQMLLSEINQKHVLAYFKNIDEQKAAESFNLAGRIMQASDTAAVLAYKENEGWDYLHLNNANMAGAKSNMFVSEKIIKDVTVNGDGTVTTKLTVDYKNPYPGSDCNLERGGLCLNAPLRNWVRVYAPKGSKLTDSKGTQSPKDGKAIPMETLEGLGKTVFEGFLIVNPLGAAKLELTYTSPVKSVDGKYRLLIQKQPGIAGPEYTIKLGGKTRKEMQLLSDTELVL